MAKKKKKEERETDGEEVDLHTKRSQTVPLCNTNATEVPKSARTSKKWSRQSRMKLASAHPAHWVRAPACSGVRAGICCF